MREKTGREVEITIQPKFLNDEDKIEKRLQQVHKKPIAAAQLLRRSIDARGRNPIFRLRYTINAPSPPLFQKSLFTPIDSKPAILIIGAGPAGYFAALQSILNGFKPIVLDRGKNVRERRRDLRSIQQDGLVNPNSNYCFGEGGAGTYSDGKLYTRSQKRGNIQQILEILVAHGAKEDILIDAHPHIGSNKLPKIVSEIRETIEQCGGEVRFNTKVTDFVIEEDTFKGVVTEAGETILAAASILATGHSARDIFALCQRYSVEMVAKPFALGVRIEHPQTIIDEAQYNQAKREENLPAASYSLTCQVMDRGVYSFCMCPGGLIVPASTAPGEIVVNGMSLSRRDSPYANSGTVVEVSAEELQRFGDQGILAGMAYQQWVEQKVFEASDGTQRAPAQRLTDFVNGKVSNTLNDTSYIPGLRSTRITDLLPKEIGERLQAAIKIFGKKMKGYYTEEANVVATESRTSCPVQILRDKQTRMSLSHKGLFPCGEGAGYAGGILSAAMDGQNVANAVSQYYEAIKVKN